MVKYSRFSSLALVVKIEMAETGKRTIVREIVKCPRCDYTCHGTQALGRHTRFKHPETLERDPKVLINRRTLRGLLELVDQGMTAPGSLKLTSKISDAVTKQDLKIHLTLMAVAQSKAMRAVALEGFLDNIVSTLIRKLTPELLENMDAVSLLNLLERLNKSVAVDTDYLKGLLSIKDAGSRRFFLRVTEMLQASSSGARRLEGVSSTLFKALEVECETMSPQEADMFREIVNDLSRQEKFEFTAGVLESESD